MTYVAGIQTGRADQSGPYGDKELLAGQAGELEKAKGWIHGAKILCANNTNWDQAPVCQRSVRGSFVDWAPCFWHRVSVEGQIFTENVSLNVEENMTMCFRFLRPFLVTLKQKTNSQHSGPSRKFSTKGHVVKMGSLVVKVNGALRHCWKELLIGEVIGAGLRNPRKRGWMGLAVGCYVFFVVLKINADVLTLDMWLVRERCGRSWLDEEERVGSEKQERVVIQRPWRESLIEL